MEEWREVDEFPGYEVSSYGRVINLHNGNGRILKPAVNQQGIPSVALRHDGVGEAHRRSVAVLIARAFLPPPPNYRYDTPTLINLNGDRMDNRPENLEWRPRAFAVHYHRQFKDEYRSGYHGRVELINTGEIFDGVHEPAAKYGLLENDIVRDLTNQYGVFPHGYLFRRVEG